MTRTMLPELTPLARIWANGVTWSVYHVPFYGIRVQHGPYIEMPMVRWEYRRTPMGTLERHNPTVYFPQYQHDESSAPNANEIVPDTVRKIVSDLMIPKETK